MRSSAIFQIVSTLASLALITLPTATEALPVRGALGNLGARARAAKRAAHHHAHQQEVEAAAAPVRTFTASPVKRAENRKAKIARAAAAAAAGMNKRDIEDYLTASERAHPVEAPVATKQFKLRARNLAADLPNPKAFLANFVVGDQVAEAASEQNASAVVAPNQAIVAPSASPVAAAPAADPQAEYLSYISAMDAAASPAASASATAPVAEDVLAATATYKIAAIVASPSSVVSAAQADVYNSYVAAMQAPTTGLWAAYTPSASSPVKH